MSRSAQTHSSQVATRQGSETFTRSQANTADTYLSEQLLAWANLLPGEIACHQRGERIPEVTAKLSELLLGLDKAREIVSTVLEDEIRREGFQLGSITSVDEGQRRGPPSTAPSASILGKRNADQMDQSEAAVLADQETTLDRPAKRPRQDEQHSDRCRTTASQALGYLEMMEQLGDQANQAPTTQMPPGPSQNRTAVPGISELLNPETAADRINSAKAYCKSTTGTEDEWKLHLLADIALDASKAHGLFKPLAGAAPVRDATPGRDATTSSPVLSAASTGTLPGSSCSSPSKPRKPLPSSRPRSSGSAASRSEPENRTPLLAAQPLSRKKTPSRSEASSSALSSPRSRGQSPQEKKAKVQQKSRTAQTKSRVPPIQSQTMTRSEEQDHPAVSTTTAVAQTQTEPSTSSYPEPFKYIPGTRLPAELINAAIPDAAAPPIITDARGNPQELSAKTLAAYEKCRDIHTKGAGGFRKPVPCLGCQRTDKLAITCIVNESVGGGLVCNNCAKKKEKCSYQLVADGEQVRECGVRMDDIGGACGRCKALVDKKRLEGDVKYRHECYVAGAGMRKGLGTACSACMIAGKKESCSLNETPRLRSHKPRDMARGRDTELEGSG